MWAARPPVKGALRLAALALDGSWQHPCGQGLVAFLGEQVPRLRQRGFWQCSEEGTNRLLRPEGAVQQADRAEMLSSARRPSANVTTDKTTEPGTTLDTGLQQRQSNSGLLADGWSAAHGTAGRHLVPWPVMPLVPNVAA